MLKQCVLALLCCATLVALVPLGASAVGVQPLVIDLDVKPGDTKNFTLDLYAGDSAESVSISMYQLSQLESGELAYKKPEGDGFPAGRWVTLDQTTLSLLPKESKQVSGQVTIPMTARGSNTVVLMVNSDSPTKMGTTGVFIRYAVRLNIRVDRPDQRPEAVLTDAALKPGQKREAVLQARVTNRSLVDYLAGVEATIRDSGQRLLERVTLRTVAGADENAKTRVYPGANVLWYGRLTKPLPPGKYEIRFYLSYAEHGQRVISQAVTVNEGDYALPPGTATYTAVSPVELSSVLKPGGLSTEALEIQNVHKDPILVRLALGDVATGYPRSLAQWTKVRGAAEVVLRPLERRKIPITVQPPKGVEPGGYYGNLEVTACSSDGTQTLETQRVPLTAVVGQAEPINFEPLSATGTRGEAGFTVVVEAANRGNLHAAPTGRLILRDAAGQVVGTVTLKLEEDRVRILPGQTGQLVGTLETVPPSGTYTAEITLECAGKKAGEGRLPVTWENR